MPSPKLEPLVLSTEERQVLEGWVRRRKTSQAMALWRPAADAAAGPVGEAGAAPELAGRRS